MRYYVYLAFLLAVIILGTNVEPANGQQKTKALEEKLQQLADLTAKKSTIRLNYQRFKELVRSPPRDYAFIVMFTALAPGRKCAICQHINDEFLVVADSYRFSSAYNKPSKLYFGIIDYDEAADVFQKMRLNTAPLIMHFAEKGKPTKADTMDFERAGIHAESIAKFIQDRTDIPIRVYRPPNYSGAVAIVMLVTLFGAILYVRRNNLQFLYNKQMWAVAAVFFCFSMSSGQMWNQIRGAPMYNRGKNGPIYINGSSNGQFVLESYLVMMLNCAVVIGMILMIEGAGGVNNTPAPATSTEHKRKRFMSIAGLIILCVFFSILLSIFKAKTAGYPYSFLFK